MDVGLRQELKRPLGCPCGVSILVLVDVGLRPIIDGKDKFGTTVSILVLVDVGLRLSISYLSCASAFLFQSLF